MINTYGIYIYIYIYNYIICKKEPFNNKMFLMKDSTNKYIKIQRQKTYNKIITIVLYIKTINKLNYMVNKIVTI